jgi:protein TonB
MIHARELNRLEKRSREQFEAANRRFQRRYPMTVAFCLIVATAIHGGVFAANPGLRLAHFDTARDDFVAMALPPEVRIPAPPSMIARPARPRVSETSVAREVTISPTTFEANPVQHLAPPPPVVRREEREAEPFYVPHEVEPRLLNGKEIATALKRAYPQALCEAGIHGTVVLWIFVDEGGGPTACRVHTSSGYTMLDAAARDVVAHMRFAPALHMDKPVAVWIAQPVEFKTL